MITLEINLISSNFEENCALEIHLPTQFTFNTFQEWIKHALDAELSRRWWIPTNGVGIPDCYTLAAD